jgi:hypothetical protein
MPHAISPIFEPTGVWAAAGPASTASPVTLDSSALVCGVAGTGSRSLSRRSCIGVNAHGWDMLMRRRALGGARGMGRGAEDGGAARCTLPPVRRPAALRACSLDMVLGGVTACGSFRGGGVLNLTPDEAAETGPAETPKRGARSALAARASFSREFRISRARSPRAVGPAGSPGPAISDAAKASP